MDTDDKEKPEQQYVWWNGTTRIGIDEIKKALRRMGLFAYADPTALTEGRDDGIVISKRKLTKKEIRKACKDGS